MIPPLILRAGPKAVNGSPVNPYSQSGIPVNPAMNDWPSQAWRANAWKYALRVNQPAMNPPDEEELYNQTTEISKGQAVTLGPYDLPSGKDYLTVEIELDFYYQAAQPFDVTCTYSAAAGDSLVDVVRSGVYGGADETFDDATSTGGVSISGSNTVQLPASDKVRLVTFYVFASCYFGGNTLPDATAGSVSISLSG